MLSDDFPRLPLESSHQKGEIPGSFQIQLSHYLNEDT